jgi:hypothetical protein
MPRIFYPYIFLCLITFLGCVSQKPEFKQTAFTFTYNDSVFVISGNSDPEGLREGSNDLVQRSNGNVIMWFRDDNQDGTLTIRFVGNQSLEEANTIYRHGIRLAQESGSYREKSYARRFQITIGNFHYEILSFGIESAESYNVFIIHDRTSGKSIRLRDLNRNGLLDDPDIDSETLHRYQADYQTILRKGIERSRILYDGEAYLVRLEERM